jgi:purine-binding chemotaxis protein CheW
MTAKISNQWLLFELQGQTYGFDVNHVREIVSLQKLAVHQLPGAGRFVEGVVMLRNRGIEVIEMRSAFGLPSLRKETEAILTQLGERERDHLRWLEELEACVYDHREFKLATDPHKCKFGQWYDAVMTNAQELQKLTNNDLATVDMLMKLDQPHKQIHGIAHQVHDHLAAGREMEARQLVENSRNTTLASLRNLFSKCCEQIEVVRRGLLFVLVVEDDMFGVLVDRVSEAVRFSDKEMHDMEHDMLGKGLLCGVTEWGDKGAMVQLLNVSAIARWRRGGEAALLNAKETQASGNIPSGLPWLGGASTSPGLQPTA